MPRYFFNIQDGQSNDDDEEGCELPSLDEARAQAVLAAGEMLKDKGRELWPGSEWRMTVIDETGEVACLLRFIAS